MAALLVSSALLFLVFPPLPWDLLLVERAHPSQVFHATDEIGAGAPASQPVVVWGLAGIAIR